MLATGPRHDPALVHYLARYDTPCPRCEYNLRSLIILICPECGLSIGWPALLDRPIPLKRRIAIAGVCIATLLLIASATALYSGATVGIAIFAGGTLLLAWAPLFIGDPLTLVAGILRENIWLFLALITIGKAARYAGQVAAV